MDLPPDKAKLLRSYDDVKKWELIKTQEKVCAKESPEFYLKKLLTYLDPKASRSSRKRRIIGDSTSTQVLRDLEISLRTNNIEWVREFLSEENRGLDVLIDYLTFRLALQQQQQKLLEQQQQQAEMQKSKSADGSGDGGTENEFTAGKEKDANNSINNSTTHHYNNQALKVYNNNDQHVNFLR